MSIRSKSKAVGRVALIGLLVVLLVPLAYQLMLSSPVASAFGTTDKLIKNMMVPLLVFRFFIYAAIYLFYEPITRHFTRKLNFTEDEVQLALKKRTSLMLWILVFEALITWSLITLMV